MIEIFFFDVFYMIFLRAAKKQRKKLRHYFHDVLIEWIFFDPAFFSISAILKNCIMRSSAHYFLTAKSYKLTTFSRSRITSMTNFRIKYTSDTSEMSKVKLYNASLVLFKIFVQFCSIYLVHGQFHKKDNEILF